MMSKFLKAILLTFSQREVQVAAGKAIRKLDKFTKKMDDNLLHYIACILDPRIKTKFIAAQMSQSDAQYIIGEVRSFLKEYPFEAPQHGLRVRRECRRRRGRHFAESSLSRGLLLPILTSISTPRL